MQDKEESPHQNYPGSVLLADHIQDFVQAGWLIVPDPETQEQTFDERQLRMAKYDVRLGRAYYKAGKYGILDDNSPLLEIEPYELVFVESYEIFNMPPNVVANYDLRISCCLGGLGLQTGLQLDPTYYGRFFCPLFNFSDTTVTLRYKDQLASVQFIYTTPPTGQAKQIEPFERRKYGRLSLGGALPDVPRRSGMESLRVQMEETRDALKQEKEDLEKDREKLDNLVTRFHTRIDSMVGAVFYAMAFMIGALAVVAAAISIVITSVITPPFSVKAIPLSIGLIILFGVLFGAEFWILKAMRKYQ